MSQENTRKQWGHLKLLVDIWSQFHHSSFHYYHFCKAYFDCNVGLCQIKISKRVKCSPILVHWHSQGQRKSIDLSTSWPTLFSLLYWIPVSRGQLCSIISYGLVEIPLCVSWQDGVILPAQDCPFCSRNKISLKSKRVHETFLSQNIFPWQ